MPLLPGKENFGHNVKAEMQAGKPQKQAIAIAYSTLRKGGSHTYHGGTHKGKGKKGY